MRREELLRHEVRQIDVVGIERVEDLVEAFRETSFQSRSIGICARIWEEMLKDPDVTVFMGLAGALIAGGLRKVLADTIRYNMVDVIVSTGAILYQDLYQSMGFCHYMGFPGSSDIVLHDLSVDRIYDTYVDEAGFRQLDRQIAEWFEGDGRILTSREFLFELASRIDDENSILWIARKYGVPIYCPAIADSSIGIGLSMLHVSEERPLVIDTVRDSYEMAYIVYRSRRTGAIFIGGGVPKNYINDAVVTTELFFEDARGHRYAIQITMDRPEWGGLSGSTLCEAQSWGKIHAEARKWTAYVDATIAMPLLVRYLYSRRSEFRDRPRRRFYDVLEGLKGKRKRDARSSNSSFI